MDFSVVNGFQVNLGGKGTKRTNIFKQVFPSGVNQSYLLEVHAFVNEFCQSIARQRKSLTIFKIDKLCLEPLSWIICVNSLSFHL